MKLLNNKVLATKPYTAALLIATSLAVSACGNENTDSNTGNPSSSIVPTDDIVTNDALTGDAATDNDNDDRLVNEGVDENVALYSEDGYGEVNVIRVDIITRTIAGVCNIDDMSGCTLADVLADTNSQDDFKVDIAVHFKATDFADDGTVNNAELRQRGGGARLAEQKSFRIKLDDKDVLWRNERYLQLNKHPFESSRFRNKLAFDLMAGIPDLPSFRTQFVNLWIDDGQGPVDQGLYTHVERGNDDYLERHGLSDGNLYKANFFRFRNSDLSTLLIDEDGEPLDDNLFESVLEIENGDDHRNLVAMLTALLDPQQSFDAVFDRYFDEENVLTWMAVNFLLGQKDAVLQNYFLFNPENTEKFYFLPWDYDAAFEQHVLPPDDFTEQSLRARLVYGYSNGARNTFLNNFYRGADAHDKILAKANELRNDVLSDTTIGARAALLRSASIPFATVLPDSQFNTSYTPATGTDFDEIVAANHAALRNSFGIPLPPRLLQPELIQGNWQFMWTNAYDVSGSFVSYDLQIASSPEFTAVDTLLELTDVGSGLLVNADRLGSGDLYARLIARRVDQPTVHWQVADNVLEQLDNTYHGVIRFRQ